MSEIGRVGPASHPLVIGVEDNAVILGLPHAYWVLDAASRDQFMRLWCEAEQQAEANEGRADSDCQCTAGGERCPCEADGPGGLCPCCRPDGEHRGSCVLPPASAPSVEGGAS